METVDKYIMVTLSEEEYTERSRKLASLIREQAELEAQKKSSAAYYKEQLDGVQNKIDDLIPIIESGMEERLVTCEILWNHPNAGLKTYRRIDTGEEVRTVNMTDSECSDMFRNPSAPCADMASLESTEGESEESSDAEAVEDKAEVMDIPAKELKALPIPAESTDIPDTDPGKTESEAESTDVIPLNDDRNETPLPGQLYSYRGKEYDFVPDTEETFCANCELQDTPVCDSFPTNECMGCFMKSARQTMEDLEALEKETKELESHLGTCAGCGNANVPVYHLSGGVAKCWHCIDKKNLEYMIKLKNGLAEGRVLFRAQFGYGVLQEDADLTCFRFNFQSGSWGTPIYKRGRD